MKIDCNITENYLKEKKRMTNDCEIGCHDCLIGSYNNGFDLTCVEFENTYPDKVMKKVQKWSDEHQVETRAEHFIKMFPNARTEPNNRTPSICLKSVNKNLECNRPCTDCWDEPYAEGEF